MDRKQQTFYDICLQAALDLAQADVYAADALPEPVPSARFSRRMRRLFPHVKKNRYRRLTTAARIALVAALLALLAISVAAARRYGFTLVDFGTFGMLDLEEQHNRHMEPLTYGYIPDGYVLTKQKNIGWYAYAVFENEQGQTITIDKYGSYEAVSVDTEGKEIYTVTDNGIDYTVLSSAEETSVYWMDPKGGDLYIIDGQLDVKTLLRIAEDCH